jgi:DNA ligase-associated metallophosphoesterase
MLSVPALPADASSQIAPPVNLQHRGVVLTLLPDRAIFIEALSLLLVADVHLGKARSFRSLGVPVPAGTTDENLRRLDQLLESTQASTLVVLGDLLHSAASRHPEVTDKLALWRARHSQVRCILVRGNHDDRAGDPPAQCGFEVVDEPFALDAGGSLIGCHEPRHIEGALVFAGHQHPAYRLGDRVGSIRLPCFYRLDSLVVLPAFGEFTGGWSVNGQALDEVFLTDSTRVYAIPT